MRVLGRKGAGREADDPFLDPVPEYTAKFDRARPSPQKGGGRGTKGEGNKTLTSNGRWIVRRVQTASLPSPHGPGEGWRLDIQRATDPAHDKHSGVEERAAEAVAFLTTHPCRHSAARSHPALPQQRAESWVWAPRPRPAADQQEGLVGHRRVFRKNCVMPTRPRFRTAQAKCGRCGSRTREGLRARLPKAGPAEENRTRECRFMDPSPVPGESTRIVRRPTGPTSWSRDREFAGLKIGSGHRSRTIPDVILRDLQIVGCPKDGWGRDGSGGQARQERGARSQVLSVVRVARVRTGRTIRQTRLRKDQA